MPETASNNLRARRERVFGRGAELFYDQPVEIVRGDGAWLFDADGRRYADCYNNVPCVGHGNEAVAAAMATQQRTLNVHNRYLHPGIVDYAERLLALHHDGIESVVFACSGTEANEIALRMARAATGQRGIVCTDAAYHGSAGIVDMLTAVGRSPASDSPIRSFPFPDCYRPLIEGDENALADAYLAAAGEGIRQLKAQGHGFAGLILCSILANEGLPDIPAGFMGRLTALVHAEGGLMIADEVQSGFGRTGRWWGYETLAFEPDIVVMGKPMGNGLPLAGTAASRALIEAFREHSGYFNTFASSPLQAAAGMAVLDEIARLDLLHNASEIGAYLQQGIEPLLAHSPQIGDLRRCGLFLSLEMVRGAEDRTPHPAAARRLSNRLRERGCLLSWSGAYDNAVKIRPPLVADRQHADCLLAALADVLQDPDGG